MEITVDGIIKILLKRWKFLLISILIFAIVGIMISVIIPKRYRSETVFYLLNSSSKSALSLDNLFGGSMGDMSGITSSDISGIYIDNLLKTRFVMDEIIQRTNLMERKKLKHKYLAYEWLNAHLSLNELKDGTNILTLYDNDRKFPVEILNQYISVIDSFYRDGEIFSARNYRKYLEQRETELYAKMMKSMGSLEKFKSEYKTMNPEMEYQALWEGIIIPLKQDLAGKYIEKERTAKIYNDNGQSAQLDKEYNLSNDILNSLFTDKSNLASSPLDSMPKKMKEYVLLKLNSDIDLALYSYIKTELQKSEMKEKKDVPSVYVIDKPVEPEIYYFPKKKDGAILGFFFGLIAMTAYVVIKDKKNIS